MLLLITFFLLFFLKGEGDDLLNNTALTGKETDFIVKLHDPVHIDGNSFTANAVEQIHKEKLTIQYKIATQEEKEALEEFIVGTVCKVTGVLEQPAPPRNENAFDYGRYLQRNGIFWKLKIGKINECVKTTNVITLVQQMRQRGIQYIYTHFPPETAPLAAALIFGERTLIEQELNEAYRRLGVVHLLSISGLHVSMLVGILFYIGLRTQLTREKVTNLLIAFLPIYTILTGASPPVIRASFMMLFVLLFTKIKTDKKPLTIDVISIVFLSYLFLNPYIMYDIGFQLSFLVTFSLILSAQLLKKISQKPLAFLIGVSFISQLASMPILLYHFYEFSLVSVFANIPYVPLFSVVIMPLVLLLFALHPLFGQWLQPLLYVSEYFLVLLNKVTKLFASFPYSTLILGKPSFFIMLLYCVSIPYAFYKWERAKTKKMMLLFLFIPLGIISIHYASGKMTLNGEVTMIDVGQGDSILLRLPGGQDTYLIDAGGTIHFQTEEWAERSRLFEVGEDVLVPFLKSKGIATLDKLIITHGDSDHIGGALAIIKSLTVKEIVLPKVDVRSELELELIKEAEKKKIPLYFVKRGDFWLAGGTRFSILSPSYANDPNRNNQSIVIAAELGGLKWLFTGDLEAEGEAQLLATYPSLRVDVLKVGHHGSITSTTLPLLETLKPKYALISAGENNRFGHPHPDIIERLLERKIIIYRTDRDGAISYQFRAERGTFFTQLHTLFREE